MPDCGYVYIMASSFKRLYIGVTSDLGVRVRQHKEHRYPDSFTARYRIDHLVYFERYGMIEDAIARETRLKKWSRLKKISLIVENNPTWQDLSEEWGKPIAPYSEKQPS
ncbi:MAG: GIY-YIG nuclease family protein [Edaphobacter sp.]|uniref:GIY-YIG nuclease family protein n=1 Tax=Edaphobacter sp. TaxID=1934404 RepID=UPI0023841C6E|nr:GIY-YIG nuclease family protein [Edaphobacter sp.]MDE1176825.1 GIY-YIG nuclease family protein [Edaphobacter sp.]